MKKTMVALVMFAAVGCTPKQAAPVVQENGDQMAVPSEASENRQPLPHQAEKEADRTITQQIRQQVFMEDDISKRTPKTSRSSQWTASLRCAARCKMMQNARRSITSPKESRA